MLLKVLEGKLRPSENLGMKCFSVNLPKFDSQMTCSKSFPFKSFASFPMLLMESQEQSEQSEPIWHPSPSLCARHARVYRMKNHWCVEALDGSTWLNGQRLQPGWGHDAKMPKSWLEWSEWLKNTRFSCHITEVSC